MIAEAQENPVSYEEALKGGLLKGVHTYHMTHLPRYMAVSSVCNVHGCVCV